MKAKYLVIGSGRAAHHISAYFDLLKIPHQSWSRKSNQDLKAKLQQTETVLLAISDSAIKNFVDKNLSQFSGTIIHFSGANEFPGMIGLHPLVSFGPKTYDLHFYHKIPFILTQGHLRDYLPELPNPSFTIHPEKKSYYHSLCVLSGNFTTLLWQKMFNGLKELGLNRDTAFPYLQSIVENLVNNPDLALTGPLARKDSLTVEKNLQALKNDAFLEVYLSFQKIFFPEFTEKKENENPRF